MTALAVALVATACGGDDGADELSGITRSPAPLVNAVTLPSISEPGDEVNFEADPGELKAVYYGFTNCPDVCPTTMADLTVALRKMGDEADKVDVVMVTVDPDRDLDVLDAYVTSFVDDAVAAGTTDLELLRASAEPFGANWEVRTLDDGTIEVDHSPFLYLVNDAGELVLSWQFGASSDDMSNDMLTLLDRYDA
ncbi:SCO family protein [Ilumatobacter coccineus]|uniref:SCO family protein n=1 Tax=Ilumatobacter coccineus TaxID=467094 RepID=UPI000347BAD7|nr:SCO family protein [Ilumatobacter coccineus]